MCAADLENTKTNIADRNHKSAATLIGEFGRARAITINRLKQLTEAEICKSALHPRLQIPLRIMDMFLFVAEHDDHHLAKITEQNNQLAQQYPVAPAIVENGAVIQLTDVEEREIIPGYLARFVHSENMSFAFWKVQPGAKMPVHSHIHEQVSMVTKGEFALSINGKEMLLTPSRVIIIPSMSPHSGTALTYCEITDVFYPVRADYK